ncbi:MAG: MoaD/ThiS family protein [Bacteroidia bacterium]|nr:MoaD/ThiS family protein [Bacteroidia bacterium]
MIKVRFTSALKRFFPRLKDESVGGKTVADILSELEIRYPGLRYYLTDDQGCLREHVNIFIGQDLLSDRYHLTDTLCEGDEIYIMQALSGG